MGKGEGQVKPVCERCNDTHKMIIERGTDEQEVMCTGCPVPCRECQGGGFKAFCAETPCSCSCHAKSKPMMQKTRQRLAKVHKELAEIQKRGRESPRGGDGRDRYSPKKAP